MGENVFKETDCCSSSLNGHYQEGLTTILHTHTHTHAHAKKKQKKNKNLCLKVNKYEEGSTLRAYGVVKGFRLLEYEFTHGFSP